MAYFIKTSVTKRSAKYSFVKTLPISLSVSAAIILMGCQTTPIENKQETPINIQQNIASTSEISQALLAEETVDIIHPVADVDFTLSDPKTVDDIYVSDDIWQRIRGKFTFDIPENRRVTAQRNWFVKHP